MHLRRFIRCENKVFPGPQKNKVSKVYISL